MKIFSIYTTVNISKRNYLLVICIAKNNFKDDFLNIQTLRFSNIVQTIHQWKYDLFSFQMMHKSQFQ